MNIERIIRFTAGLMIMGSVLLAKIHSRCWLLLTFFVGANLFQSSITKWCLLEDFLAWAGFQTCCEKEEIKKNETSANEVVRKQTPVDGSGRVK